MDTMKPDRLLINIGPSKPGSEYETVALAIYQKESPLLFEFLLDNEEAKKELSSIIKLL